MTLTTLITTNAVLGAAAVYGLLLLLGHGIRSERADRHAVVERLHEHESDRIAA